MSHLNKFLASHDDERRLAHRSELKRKLAEIQVKRTRIAELQTIVGKLNADSEQAAAEHSVAAGVLQAELDGLDEEHVDALMVGKQTPAKSLARRGEILNELAKLNQNLELRCEANRRSVQPIQNDIDKLRVEIAEGASLNNRLADLASVEIRRKRLLNGFRLRIAEIGLKESQRLVSASKHNVDIVEENARRGFPVGSELSVAQAKLSDWQFVEKAYQAEMREIQENDRSIEAEALAE